MGDLLCYKLDTGKQRRAVNLIHSSHGFKVENKFYFFVCWGHPLSLWWRWTQRDGVVADIVRERRLADAN